MLDESYPSGNTLRLVVLLLSAERSGILWRPVLLKLADAVSVNNVVSSL